MNYRHIYHAGNICDVVKHAVLTLLTAHLRAKEKPFAILDTHAGIGLYDLDDEQARKTGEADIGIRRLFDAAPISALDEYYRAIREANPEGGLRHYPGSPVLIRNLLRSHDKLIACELHPEDARKLKRLFHGDKQVQVHQRDGYEALAALWPPQERRGLVLIDPPFETPGEFKNLADVLNALLKRWPAAEAVVWYPIKERPALWHFHEAMADLPAPEILCAEFIYREETRHDRLNGCGFIFINPSWGFEKKVEPLFMALHHALRTEYRGCTVKWLRGAHAA
jgi:23S rRNA (adenine2030-N6)-methyltransferase